MSFQLNADKQAEPSACGLMGELKNAGRTNAKKKTLTCQDCAGQVTFKDRDEKCKDTLLSRHFSLSFCLSLSHTHTFKISFILRKYI